MGALFNMRRMTVTSTGTGPITLGVAASGWRSFSAAPAIPTGTIVSYRISDGADWELQEGVFNSAAGTLTRIRTSPESSTGALLNLTTNALVTISSLAEDLIGSNLRLPPRSGNWFGEFTSWSQGALAANTLRYVPLICSQPTVLDRVSMFVGTGTAGGLIKVGLYAPHSTTRLPNARLAECAADLDASTSGRKDGTFGSNPTAPAGLSWICIAANNSSITSHLVESGFLPSFCLQNSIDIGIANSAISTISIGENLTYVSGSAFLPATASPSVAVFGQTPIGVARAL